MLPPAAWEAMKVTKERRASTNVFGGELVLKAEEDSGKSPSSPPSDNHVTCATTSSSARGLFSLVHCFCGIKKKLSELPIN